MRYGYLLWGVLAGVVGAVAGALILWGSWLLPVLGLLLTRVSLLHGFFSLAVFGALGGLLYAAVLRRRRLRRAATILAGAALGAVLWLGGALIVIPMLLGFTPQVQSPLDHWVPLVAFVFYGIIVALLYSRWSLKQSRARIYYAIGLLAAAAILTPFMLRAAVSTEPEALQLPEGYRAEVVAKGFTFPTSIAVGPNGLIYVAESGFSYGPKTTTARILLVAPDGAVREVARDFEGPLNGLALRDNRLYVSHRGKITELNLDSGKRRDLVTGLPSLGDHQNNDLVFGADGALYFGQGSATNAGVVGSDNFVYAWTDRYPDFHDRPSRSFTLTGENYESLDLGTPDPADTKTTGAFAPFGTKRGRGEKVSGAVPGSGAVHRLDLATGELSVYADGLRNPYGLAVDGGGAIYASNLGYDDRGVRAVKSSPDWLVRLREGAWYGWPDYAGTIPLTEPLFASGRGVNRRPLLFDPPPVEPPLATFPPHYSPMKLAAVPGAFPARGLLVAIFGDGQPLTEDLDRLVPTGVLKVDPASGRFDWFLRNKGGARAGRTGNGLKRAIDVKFSPDGTALYLLDFGVMEFTDMAPNAIPRTGVLWKIIPSE
jgi:glucose/arabinose dehydrogenase